MKLAGRIRSLIAKAGLPAGGLKPRPGAVVDAMAFDKKVKSGRFGSSCSTGSATRHPRRRAGRLSTSSVEGQ